MIEELNSASKLLLVALERYLCACSALETYAISQGLVDCLTKELSLTTAYAAKILHAKAALGRNRNRSSLVPINSLPTEVLARVFDNLIASQRCNGENVLQDENARASLFNNHKHTHFLMAKYPGLLTHVCSRWRQIITNSANFWSHVDLAPRHRFNKKLLSLAKAITAQTNHHLDIHIVDNIPGPRDPCDDDTQLFQFLSSAAKRMRSLDLVIQRPFTDFHHSIFQTCFVNAIPGTFTQLDAYYEHSGGSPRYVFIKVTQNPKRTNSILPDLPEQLLENLWRHVKVLRLCRLYPDWASQAYHGLIELRLVSSCTPKTSVTESQLISVLATSPRLRILQFDLEITDSTASAITPVCLNDLEVLNIESLWGDQINIFLRLIAPGSKLSQLALRHPGSLDVSLKDKIRQLFAGSKLTKLYLKGSDKHQLLTELLSLSPNLQNLAIADSRYEERRAPMFDPNRGDGNVTTGPHLDSVHLELCNVDLDELLCMLKRHPAHTLTMRHCQFYRNGERVFDKQQINISSFQVRTIVKLDHTEANVAQWELFHPAMRGHPSDCY